MVLTDAGERKSEWILSMVLTDSEGERVGLVHGADRY